MFNARSGLALAQLIFYFPVLFVAFYITLRHGFSKHLGWIFLVILSLARIIGGASTIALEISPSTNLLIVVSIMQSVGLSPLLLTTLGLLSRVNGGLKYGPVIPARLLHLLGIVLIVGLVLCIVGGVDSSSDPAALVNGPGTLSKVGIVLFCVGYVVEAGITAVLFRHFRGIIQGDETLLIAVGASLPFLLVRLVYSLMVVFAHNPNFNVLTGSVIIQAFMATLEEFIVVLLYVTAGLRAPKIQRSQIEMGAQ